MRAGRIVQQGEIADVWRAPVDAETALFLGYARVLSGMPRPGLVAARAPPADAVALRRSALRLDGRAAGRPGRLRAGDARSRSGSSSTSTGSASLDAVAPLDRHPRPGECVRLAVDHTRMAVISGRRAQRPSLDCARCIAAPMP